MKCNYLWLLIDVKHFLLRFARRQATYQFEESESESIKYEPPFCAIIVPISFEEGNHPGCSPRAYLEISFLHLGYIN